MLILEQQTCRHSTSFSQLSVYSVPSGDGISSGMATDILSSVISTLSSKVAFFCTSGTLKDNDIKCTLFQFHCENIVSKC